MDLDLKLGDTLRKGSNGGSILPLGAKRLQCRETGRETINLGSGTSLTTSNFAHHQDRNLWGNGMRLCLLIQKVEACMVTRHLNRKCICS